jgi:hypothetical protein
MSPDDPFKRPFPDENYVPPSEADLRKQGLQKAYEIAKSISVEPRSARERAPIDRGPLLRAANAVLAVTVALWIVFSPPDWLPRSVVDRRSPEQRQQGMRMVLAMEAARITAFRDAEGRLPASLGEVGGDARSVQYRAINATEFTLTTADGAASARYTSAQSLSELLGGTGTAP